MALVDCSGCSHSMNPSLLLHMVEAIAILTVKVDVNPTRVIVLTRVTSEKLTRRKDHADNRPLQHVQYLELYLNNQKSKLTSVTEVGQLMESVCARQHYWSHFYCTGVHHTIPFINMMAHCHCLRVEQHFLLDLELSICCHQWWEIHNSLKNVEGMDYCKRLFIIGNNFLKLTLHTCSSTSQQPAPLVVKPQPEPGSSATIRAMLSSGLQKMRWRQVKCMCVSKLQ